MKSSKAIIKINAWQQTTQLDFGRKFHDLNYFELRIIFQIPWIQCQLEDILKNI